MTKGHLRLPRVQLGENEVCNRPRNSPAAWSSLELHRPPGLERNGGACSPSTCLAGSHLVNIRGSLMGGGLDLAGGCSRPGFPTLSPASSCPRLPLKLEFLHLKSKKFGPHDL